MAASESSQSVSEFSPSPSASTVSNVAALQSLSIPSYKTSVALELMAASESSQSVSAASPSPSASTAAVGA